jgi:hypothetical protein
MTRAFNQSEHLLVNVHILIKVNVLKNHDFL